jgi:hypothetical protein
MCVCGCIGWGVEWGISICHIRNMRMEKEEVITENLALVVSHPLWDDGAAVNIDRVF